MSRFMMGIGNRMLQALKRVYSGTKCVLSLGDETSDPFQTYTGIRQGVPSSVFLFILFIVDLITYLKANCIEEPLIGLMHCLLHTDDTAVISTDRELFIKECNIMIQYMKDNSPSLSLNMSKSSNHHMIINGKPDNYKTDLSFNGGALEYKDKVAYLGVVISDTGVIQHPVDSYIRGKSLNITFKFNNFWRKNFLSPINIKLKVLDVCATASLFYCCETGSNCTYTKLESLYRKGARYALSNITNKEIVYLGSSRVPLFIQIKKHQLQFWKTLQTSYNDTPGNPLQQIIEKAELVSSKYLTIKIWFNLHKTPTNCQKT